MRFAISFQRQTETPMILAIASRVSPKNTNESQLKANSSSQKVFSLKGNNLADAQLSKPEPSFRSNPTFRSVLGS
jgi:hypothetical protein